jgi:hypothetical protein
VQHALLRRDAAADAEDQDRDDQAPEEDFLAMTERVLGIGRCGATA